MASTLTHTFSTPTGNKKFTLSMWVKRSDIGSDGSIFSTYTDSNNRADIRFNSADRFSFFEKVSSQQYFVTTNRLFRDPSGFYHIVVQFDTTQSTAADRIKLWVNGSQETSFNDTSYPSQDYVLRLGSALAHTIGDNSNNADQFQGYISHMAFVDGSVVAPTVFGETDSTSGIWKFKTPTGVTFGNNGFHLKFENSGALGTDSSGNSNTFTVNGNLKQALDTPSNVHATINPLDNYYAASTFSNGNNTIISGTTPNTWNTATLGVSSGKWYWETELDAESSGGSALFGIADRPTDSATRELGDLATTYAYLSSGNFRTNNSNTSNGVSATVGDIIGIALDLDNNQISYYKNGTIIGSAQSITAPSSTVNGVYFPAWGDWLDPGTVTFKCNFGNGFFGTTAITSAGSNGNGSLFEYDVPSGFYALNTKNINTYG